MLTKKYNPYFLFLIFLHLPIPVLSYDGWTCFTDNPGPPNIADCMQAGMSILSEAKSCDGKIRVGAGGWGNPSVIESYGSCDVFLWATTDIDVTGSDMLLGLTNAIGACPGAWGLGQSDTLGWAIGMRPHISLNGRRAGPSTNIPRSLQSRQRPGQCKPLPDSALTTMEVSQLRRLEVSGSLQPQSLPASTIEKLAAKLVSDIYGDGNEVSYVASANLSPTKSFSVMLQDEGELWDRLKAIYPPSKARGVGNNLLKGDLADAINWLLKEGAQSTINDINRTGDFSTAAVFMMTAIYNNNGGMPPGSVDSDDDDPNPGTPPPQQCDICATINEAAKMSTYVRQPWKREVMDWHDGEDEDFGSLAKFRARRLEKRGWRKYSSGPVGSYGRAFGNGQPQVQLAVGDDVFGWRGRPYPSTRRPTNSQAPPGVIIWGDAAGEEVDDGDDLGSDLEPGETVSFQVFLFTQLHSGKALLPGSIVEPLLPLRLLHTCALVELASRIADNSKTNS